jgi:cytochrome c oxidase cbb3-type subunit 3
MMVLAAPQGNRLYAAHCAACHGETGSGGVGVPLSLPSFLDSVDDEFLRITIRQGRPGRVMPAFNSLSDAQVNAIIGHLRSWSDKPAPVYARTKIDGDVERGGQLYATHCAECHGENGEGGKGTGVAFSRKRAHDIVPPALNNSAFLAAASDEMIRRTLQEGRKGTPMQSYLKQGLSGQQINDLVSYVRSFEQQLASPEAPPDSPMEAAISMESSYSLEETVANLKDAIVSQNFILIREDTLEHGLVQEGEDDPSERILHFCNFKFLYDALEVDPRIGMFLPCQVNVTETDGKVLVTTINPVYLSRLFNNDELTEYCEKMYELYVTILEDATL